MTTNEDDELALLATDKKFKRIFKKAASELEKNKDNEYKYKIHISKVVPLLRSFIIYLMLQNVDNSFMGFWAGVGATIFSIILVVTIMDLIKEGMGE